MERSNDKENPCNDRFGYTLCWLDYGNRSAIRKRWRSCRPWVRFAHQNFAAMHAALPEPPTVFPSRRPQPYPYNFHETDGLSRNPNDCAVWGCIDSN